MSDPASNHIETEEVLIPPRKRLMRTIGLAGYSIPEAINELVDNSIDAAIEGQPLLVQVLIGKAKIAVKDNGTGRKPSTKTAGASNGTRGVREGPFLMLHGA